MKDIEARAIIFDMDGTLYKFDQRDESNFISSNFGEQIYANCVRFFEERFSLTKEEAVAKYQELSQKYAGEVSIAVEKEYGIDRSEYFAFTWDLKVEDFIEFTTEVRELLSSLALNIGILTAAPKVWAERVLTFLQVKELFKEAVFTGDPDLRKPNPQAFQQLADFWGLNPEEIISIGDQEQSDILPAKSLGMTTVRIAKNVETEADFQAVDLLEAIAILKNEGIICKKLK